MLGFRNGCIYGVGTAGVMAKAVLVVSEDDWNQWATDSVVVPLYGTDRPLTPSLLCPRVAGLVADCTRVLSMPHEDFGEFIAPGEQHDVAAVRAGMAAFLCVDDLRQGQSSGRPARGANAWYPSQGHVYHANPPKHPLHKMYGVLTDDVWNADHEYVATVRLTSHVKARRAEWETPVRGGCICVGNIFQVDIGDIRQRPPEPPRPRVLSPDERRALGAGLTELLALP